MTDIADPEAGEVAANVIEKAADEHRPLAQLQGDLAEMNEDNIHAHASRLPSEDAQGQRSRRRLPHRLPMHGAPRTMRA